MLATVAQCFHLPQQHAPTTTNKEMLLSLDNTRHVGQSLLALDAHYLWYYTGGIMCKFAAKFENICCRCSL